MVVIYTWLGTDTSRGFPCCTCVFCTTEPLAPNAELNLSATLVFLQKVHTYVSLRYMWVLFWYKLPMNLQSLVLHFDESRNYLCCCNRIGCISEVKSMGHFKERYQTMRFVWTKFTQSWRNNVQGLLTCEIFLVGSCRDKQTLDHTKQYLMLAFPSAYYCGK